MSVTLTLDPAIRTILEPGFHQRFSSREALGTLQVGTGSDTPNLWADPVTGTLMLYPQQLRPDWLNSGDQVAHIIRFSEMVVNGDDISNGTVFEEFAFGNNWNYYIYHSPVGFPGTPSAGPPGTAPSLTGLAQPTTFSSGLATLSSETEVPFVTYTAPETTAGSVSTGKVICHSAARLAANQSIYLRWFHPNPKIGHQTRYIFYLGQLAIEIVGNVVVLWTDISPHGDRSSYIRIWAKPMFGPGDFAPDQDYSNVAKMNGAEGSDHDRSLLIIPFFRDRLLLVASGISGNSSAYAPRILSTPNPTGDAVTPWLITREDTLMVWCITPAPGRFQVQKVRYATGPVTLQLPPVVIDYAPSTPPVVTKWCDQPHGTSLSGAIAYPATYALRFNALNDCPPATTGDGAQGRSYGVSLTFTGESTHRWTPFFYGLDVDAAVVLQNNPLIPSQVLDTGVPATNIQDGSVSWGDEPGDGRMTCTIIDESPYGFSGQYYRSLVPVQLLAGATECFTGYTEPHEVIPWHESTRPREVKLTASDRWRQLADTYLRDQKDFSGTGHISAVLFVASQAGVDPATAETLSLTPANNTPLAALPGLLEPTALQTKQLKSAWAPRLEDTAASFIKRVAELFSGWDVGFRGDGTFYYLPKDHWTSVSLRFYHSLAAATVAGEPNNPLVRDPVKFVTLPPEGNVVQVVAADEKEGKELHSSLWVDWASILNPAVANYVGRWMPVVYILGGVYSCTEINRIARVLFETVRRRRRQIEFTSAFVPTLKIGQIVEVGTYGQYRLKSVKAEFVSHNWDPATYVGELVEAGVGL